MTLENMGVEPNLASLAKSLDDHSKPDAPASCSKSKKKLTDALNRKPKRARAKAKLPVEY